MQIEKISDNIYEIPKQSMVVKVHDDIQKFDMLVPARIYANEFLLRKIKIDKTIDQIANVACIPGIKKYAIALSDAHQGYGFCIGGVAGTDILEGAISPGGVGYDINCGVRLIRTNLQSRDITPTIPQLVNRLFDEIPSGLGSQGQLRVNQTDLDKILDTGVNWAIQNGYGWDEDKIYCEENGSMEKADSSLVSKKAKSRGISQIGSLGSGNHFVEVQKVDVIYEPEVAKVFGIHNVGQVTVMVHTGSRAVGHQICQDSLNEMEYAIKKYKIRVPDRQLACVMGNMKEADIYLSQMSAAANFAWSNRQMITHWVRETFRKEYERDPEDLDMHLIYDVCHNILKQEEHTVDGKKMMLNVHRKGATRAFPAGHKDVAEKYRSVGQPVLIPGSMGTASYLCIGQPNSMEISFGSSAHGSGREISRTKASKQRWGSEVRKELNKMGISIKAASDKVIAEEAPEAYKDIDQVVQVSHDLGIVKKIVRLVPLGVAKG